MGSNLSATYTSLSLSPTDSDGSFLGIGPARSCLTPSLSNWPIIKSTIDSSNAVRATCSKGCWNAVAVDMHTTAREMTISFGAVHPSAVAGF
jgi:hypothetical protein